MIVSIVGNLGSGKSLLLTLLGCMELDENRSVYATYHVSYIGKTGNKPIYVDVGDLAQWMNQQGKKGMFAPHSSVLLLDEGYAGMDSRSSSSIANRMLSHFVFQSRKLGLDLMVAVQLSSSLDKRIRNLTDAWILAEIMPRQDEQGNYQKCPDCGNQVDDFRYTYASVDGSSNEFWLEHEKAHVVWKWYSTMEIVQPPMMALDKKEALKAKKAVQQQGIVARRKQRSEISPE